MGLENFLQCNTNDRATRAARRRAHILEISRGLFIENGFHGTGVAQIASASGVKVGQIYRDFPSKEAIIAAIALRDFSQFMDEAGLSAAIAADDKATVREWILAFTDYDEDVDGYRLMPEIMAESVRNPRLAELREEMRDTVRGALMAALSTCAPGAWLADARSDLADLIATLGSGLCQWIVMEERTGRGHQTLCAQLRAIVERELNALEDRSRHGEPITIERVFQPTDRVCPAPDTVRHGCH